MKSLFQHWIRSFAMALVPFTALLGNSFANPEYPKTVAAYLVNPINASGRWCPTPSSYGNRWLAYASDVNGTSDIWMRNMINGQTLQLTSGSEFDVDPLWSNEILPENQARLVFSRIDGPKANLFQLVIDLNTGQLLTEIQPNSDLGSAESAVKDDAFYFREVFVYPNPTRGERNPTFHVEVGRADRVKISIHDISGAELHEVTLTEAPARMASVEGNTKPWAYEYVWPNNIPSGTYIYTVEAEKADQRLVKSGLWAVLR